MERDHSRHKSKQHDNRKYVLLGRLSPFVFGRVELLFEFLFLVRVKVVKVVIVGIGSGRRRSGIR